MKPGQAHIIKADLADARHAAALVDVLDAYARDPMGGGAPLSPFARENLARELARRPHAHVLLAFDGDALDGTAVGLLNCIEGFSTFACQPLLNIHDLAVKPAWRGRGIGRQLLARAEVLARELGCCKLTLEVLQGNAPARALYRECGFAGYALDEAMGEAVFLQKMLPGLGP